MIITQDTSKKLLDSAQVAADEPPPYSPQTEQAGGGSTSLPVSFKSKPTNYLTLSNEHDSIRGEFVIDPSMPIPASSLAPLACDQTEADRKNLSLQSSNGSIHVDLWLLGPSGDVKIDPSRLRRTTLSLKSSHGSVSAQVRTLNNTAPFFLTGYSGHGSVRLALPRSFEGLVSVTTRHGSVNMSDDILQNATQLSQLSNTRRYFVGDFQLLGDEPWQGDQVEVEAPHGSIHVKYVDGLAVSQGRKGLFNRLFG